MTHFQPAKIESAEYDGRCKVKVRQNGGGMINTYLKDSDIKRAAKRLHLRTIPKTDAEYTRFCSFLQGETIEMSMGGNADVTVEEMYRKERKRMGDTSKKVEFKLHNVIDGFDGSRVHSLLVGMKDEIRTKANIGTSLKQIISAKGEDGEDKKGDFTVVVSFNKAFAEKDSFDAAMCAVAETIKGIKELGDSVKVDIEKKD
jgi:hypothetical protein